MLKSKSKIFLVLFVIVMLISTAVYATDVTPTPGDTNTATPENTATTTPDATTGEGNMVSEDDIVQFDKFYAGDDIVIDELINGNVFAVGKNVTLTGQIAGNLVVIAENVNIEKGTIMYGSLFVVASEATINGHMYDLYAMGDKVTVGYYGTTERDTKIMASEVSIAGVVYRDLYVEANKLTLNTDCDVKGNLTYIAQEEAKYLEKAGEEEETTTNNDGPYTGPTQETTEIPATVVAGEKLFTQRDKKLFNKDDEVKSKVQEFIKNNKITNETSGEELQAILLSNVTSNLGINTNSSTTEKTTSNTMRIPSIVVYIDIAVIVLLVVALVIVVVKKRDKKPKEEKID